MDRPDGDAHQVAEGLGLEFRGETGGKGRVEEKKEGRKGGGGERGGGEKEEEEKEVGEKEEIGRAHV